MKSTTQYQIENIIRMARRHLKLRTMKAAKEMMLNFMKPEEFPADIDWSRINALFADALAARRIADFTAAIDAAEVAANAPEAKPVMTFTGAEETEHRNGQSVPTSPLTRYVAESSYAPEAGHYVNLAREVDTGRLVEYVFVVSVDGVEQEAQEPDVSVKPVSASNGRPTYRVSIRGRHYLYTVGNPYAQLRVKQKGGTHHYRTINSAYMVDKIQRAIDKFRA